MNIDLYMTVLYAAHLRPEGPEGRWSPTKEYRLHVSTSLYKARYVQKNVHKNERTAERHDMRGYLSAITLAVTGTLLSPLQHPRSINDIPAAASE